MNLVLPTVSKQQLVAMAYRPASHKAGTKASNGGFLLQDSEPRKLLARINPGNVRRGGFLPATGLSASSAAVVTLVQTSVKRCTANRIFVPSDKTQSVSRNSQFNPEIEE
jgi:hypothetical protein